MTTTSIFHRSRNHAFTASVLAAALFGCSATQPVRSDLAGARYATPEEAVAAVAAVAGTRDQEKTTAIFGPGAAELFDSGDEVADRHAGEDIRSLIQEKVAFEDAGDGTRIALFGNEGWPFAIPLVKANGGWAFDLEAGREEITNRRIGANELSTLATLHAIVDAQREYFAGAPGRRGTYARRLLSSKGKRDGLFWPVREGQAPSPLGPLAAEAEAGGYATGADAPPGAFHGYHYRVLSAQGPSAPGGARSYVDARGAMSKGFAVIAWPARHGNSGIMTFVVGAEGIVFQKDLGEGTDGIARSVTAFDPDDTWTPTAD